MKLYLIAGEPSGDFIGSKIINQIKSSNSEVELFGVGGAKMLNAGLDSSLFPMEQISLFGLFEILPHVLRIRRLIKLTVQDIISKKPGVLVSIDSPGFCFRVVAEVKRLAPEIKRIHIVAPSVWAYKPERAIKVASLYHHLLTLLPFEPQLFEKYGIKTSCIGHPIFEQDFGSYLTENYLNQFRVEYKMSKDVIAITPGSRKGEIKRHLSIFAQGIIDAGLGKTTCIIVSDNKANNQLIKDILFKYKLRYLITDRKALAFKLAKVVLAKSGTNTLEIAFCSTAMIVGYKINMLSWLWLKRLIKIKYASLINIIADNEIIPELIQEKLTAKNVAIQLNKLLNDDNIRKKQIDASFSIIKQMGLGDTNAPSTKAANIILQYLQSK
jgi:lipid-A-disaccharide synthase